MFAGAGAFALLVALISAFGLRPKPALSPEFEVQAFRLRSLAGEATLRGLTVQSAAARES